MCGVTMREFCSVPCCLRWGLGRGIEPRDIIVRALRDVSVLIYPTPSFGFHLGKGDGECLVLRDVSVGGNRYVGILCLAVGG